MRSFCAREKMHLYCHDLESIPEIARPEGITVGELDFARTDALQAVEAHNAADLAARQARGDRCYLAALDGRTAHFSWVQAAGGTPWRGRGGRFPLPPVNSGFIIASRRSGLAAGLYSFVLARILQDYRKAGYSRCWIYTTWRNTASQRGILRAGFKSQWDLNAFMFCGRAIPLGERM